MRIQKFRYAFIFGNIITTFFGVTILIIAVLSFFVPNHIPEFLSNVFFDTVTKVGSAIIGLMMFGIGVVGCCGGFQKRRSMLGTYAVIVLLLFLAQIGAVVYFIVQKGTFPVVFERTWNLLDKQTTKYIENKFDCYGPGLTNSSTSFTTSSENQEPCVEVLMEQFNDNIAVYIVLALTLCVLQIISITLAVMLFCAPKKVNQVFNDEESYPRLSRWAESRM
ncbi:CD9 antigen [Holothuria leucospilota]|uniref:CD9 antigen n=1 Tax=Holothuria leucospilota TaxID=206669 RepID=A0A9Q1BCG0_HOLLE|nr:CD9 antigen [Holothuria leucospilota]